MIWPVVGQWRCVASLASWFLLVIFSTHITAKSNDQINSCIPGTRNETTSGIAVQLELSHNQIYRNPLSFSKMPSVFCTWQIGGLQRDVVGITKLATFKPSINVILFTGRNSSNGFHLSIPIVTAFTLQVRGPMWGFCQLLNMSFFF